jgi:hypothetical protein
VLEERSGRIGFSSIQARSSHASSGRDPVGRLGGGIRGRGVRYVDGDTAIAELHSTSKTNEGADFANDYCWVCRFDGDTIVEVRGYLDSLMVAYTILRNDASRDS